MGTPVQVDSDDLEALLFATSAIKGIEDALKTSKADEFGVRTRGKLTQAHDNLANAMRGALRRQEFPERFSPPSDAEVRELIGLFPIPHSKLEVVRFWPQELRRGVADHRDLLVRGLVEFGVMKEVLHWSSTGQTTTAKQTQVMRPTQRAIDAILLLESIDADVAARPVTEATEGEKNG